MAEVGIEVLKLIGTFLAGSLSSGGIIMYFLHKNDRLALHEKLIDRISEGLQLLLENDIVIFNALRNGHINGESERQEKRMKDYFYKCSIKGFDIKHHQEQEEER